MNLLSCHNCGVVLDADYLQFDHDFMLVTGVDESKAAWDGEDYVPYVPCPVCEAIVFEPAR